jgi:hypothetical protein
VALAPGHEIKDVTLDDSDGGTTNVYLPTDPMKMADVFAVCAAGAECEHIVGGSWTWGAMSDSDHEPTRRYECLAADPPSHSLVLLGGMQRARDILKREFPAVRDLANTLRRDRRLTGKEAALCRLRALGRLKRASVSTCCLSGERW